MSLSDMKVLHITMYGINTFNLSVYNHILIYVNNFIHFFFSNLKYIL